MREIDSDCCQYLQTISILSINSRDPQICLFNLANKKSSPTLFLPNLSASVVEKEICCQNSRLYGVLTSHQQYFSCKGTDLLRWSQYLARINVLAQGHNTVTPARLELAAPAGSRVKHFTTEPLHSLYLVCSIFEVYSNYAHGCKKTQLGIIYITSAYIGIV